MSDSMTTKPRLRRGDGTTKKPAGSSRMELRVSVDDVENAAQILAVFYDPTTLAQAMKQARFANRQRRTYSS